MRLKLFVAIALVTALSGVAFAELQNVEIGGSIRIRGNYFNMDYLRLMNGFTFNGGPGVIGFGKHALIEQRTRLNVKADFTQEVSAFIELDSYNWWGEDFRSNYLTGADVRGGDNVELYQAYIEARNLWGAPLTARVGRQELSFGSELFVGTNDSSSFFTGLSFDALRLTYASDILSIDAVAAKLAESLGDFGEDDVDLYALYGSYTGIEDVTLDAYWMFLRDDQGLLANIINGGEVDLHTLGLRGAGVIGGFDFEMEAAYQLGNVDGMPSACPLGFGEADVDFDELAINMEVGYTFDATCQPRLFARFAYYGGGDPDDALCSNDLTMPFNRLFSNVQYSEFLDNFTLFRNATSNMFFYSLGMQAMATESIELKLVASYFVADEMPNSTDDDLGWEIGLYGDYQYSEDLAVRAGYSHFFVEDGLVSAVSSGNGWIPWRADEDDDYDYVFIETEISF